MARTDGKLAPPETAGDLSGLRVERAPPRAEAAAVDPEGAISPGSSEERLLEQSPENRLAVVRLGMASSLFTALRHKHADTAEHSLRVTLNTAAWAMSLDMSDEQRDLLEVAALLHDVGKIGVPDKILMKPGPLTEDEMRVMDHHRLLGLEILHHSCNSRAVLEIVGCAPARFDGTHSRLRLAGKDIPLGSRMLAICDAFDAMTSDQVYRRALSQESAMAELFRHSGSQFDPELVDLFAASQRHDAATLRDDVARQWLTRLKPREVDGLWRLNLDLPTARMGEGRTDQIFRERLVDSMRDAVIFVDVSLRITLWNQGAERLTGIPGAGVLQRHFSPEMFDLHTDAGARVFDDMCPVADALKANEIRIRRYILRGRQQKEVTVEMQVVPVTSDDGRPHGAAVLLRDVSPELSLEARCQSLHQAATKDPLTGVANRAEFNRVHQMFVMAHLERKLPCSLIIADIDHFKKVNDTFGHQAGDEVLKSFAQLMKQSCRPGDLVARYGGEEFVILCADCNNAAAYRRADAIRRSFSQFPHEVMNGRSATSSFGVTEIQDGDTPDTMVSRADRALYEAKEAGRNCVVQLGSGLRDADEDDEPAEAPVARQELLVEANLITFVPRAVVVEKLRGFVADHQAEILSVDDTSVRMQVGTVGGIFRRLSDRRVPCFVHLTFVGAAPAEHDAPSRGGTRLHIEVLLQRSRDRRRKDAMQRGRQLLSSLRSYLMASDDTKPHEESGSHLI